MTLTRLYAPAMASLLPCGGMTTKTQQNVVTQYEHMGVKLPHPSILSHVQVKGDVSVHLNAQQHSTKYSSIQSNGKQIASCRCHSMIPLPPMPVIDNTHCQTTKHSATIFPPVPPQSTKSEGTTFPYKNPTGGRPITGPSDAHSSSPSDSPILDNPVGCMHSRSPAAVAPYVQSLLRQGNVTRAAYVTSLIYHERFMGRIANPQTSGLLADKTLRDAVSCRYCLSLGLLVLASKYVEDITYTNRAWADWGGVQLERLNRLEVGLLKVRCLTVLR